LGVPRGIARRYIADHVSLADRTEASSQFVTAGALGLALGPLLSSLVSASRVTFTWAWGDLTIMRYELVTAPGWLMAALFYATLVVLVVAFEEPYIDPTPPAPTTRLSGSQHARRQSLKRGGDSGRQSKKDASPSHGTAQLTPKEAASVARAATFFSSLSANSLHDAAAAVSASMGFKSTRSKSIDETSSVAAQAARPRYGAVPSDDVEVEMRGWKPDDPAADDGDAAPGMTKVRLVATCFLKAAVLAIAASNSPPLPLCTHTHAWA